MDHVQDSLQAEAVACAQAMNQAIQWGMTNVMVETDSQLLVQAVNNSKSFDLAPNGVLFRGIKALAMLRFNSFFGWLLPSDM